MQSTNSNFDLQNANDSVAIYGSDDGGTTKRIIKTDAGGAIQVDLEVASVTVTSGAITETNSGTIAGDTTSIDGKITACDTGAVVVASGAITETNSGTIAGDTTSIDGKITACNTGAVVISTNVRPVTPSNINTAAYATNLVVKAAAGTCFEVRGFNSGAAQFIQVHDASSLPADTAVPEDILYVAAASNFSLTYPEGKAFTTGITLCNSSTGPTKTVGAADCWFSAEFI